MQIAIKMHKYENFFILLLIHPKFIVDRPHSPHITKQLVHPNKTKKKREQVAGGNTTIFKHNDTPQQ